MRRSVLAVLALATATFLATPAMAHSKSGPDHGYYAPRPPSSHWDKPNNYRPQQPHYPQYRDQFSARDEQIISQWYRKSRYNPVHPIPSSRLRQIYNYGYLPDGLYLQTLPTQLIRLIGPARPGYERYVIGRDIILVSTRNGAILDIMSNVL